MNLERGYGISACFFCFPFCEIYERFRGYTFNYDSTSDTFSRILRVFFITVTRCSFKTFLSLSLKCYRNVSFYSKYFMWNNLQANQYYTHCVKSVQIRSNFWSVFSGIRTEYGEILRIWTLFTQWLSQKLLRFSLKLRLLLRTSVVSKP